MKKQPKEREDHLSQKKSSNSRKMVKSSSGETSWDDYDYEKWLSHSE